ncbi:hypothetical protein [Brevibacillus brevis]|uniref:hypothetical protein n=1 Tax=Brevibacillus brevis TaxID=1393 RepID=UPI001EDA4A97|nr:hypothetical protein [Brevibacillus brevis]UKK98977.1 hypothetical protein FO446_16810 [Brevibacillus brevis]
MMEINNDADYKTYFYRRILTTTAIILFISTSVDGFWSSESGENTWGMILFSAVWYSGASCFISAFLINQRWKYLQRKKYQ